MSIHHHCGNGIPGEEKGYAAEEYTFSRAYISGPYGKDPADCHNYVECYHSGVGFLFAFCRECWSFSEIRGFLFTRKERK